MINMRGESDNKKSDNYLELSLRWMGGGVDKNDPRIVKWYERH